MVLRTPKAWPTWMMHGQLDDRHDDEEDGEQRDHVPHGTPGTVLPMPMVDYDRWTGSGERLEPRSPSATG